MTGLDKILAQIQLDADNVCADIKKQSDLQCKDIIENAKSRANDIVSKGEANAQKKHDEIIARAESAAELERRSVILSAKQSAIADALDTARCNLCELPDNEYFSLILKMAQKYSEDSDGVMRFNSKDAARIPADFSTKLSSVIKGKLIVDKEVADIDGGFILIYGGIEINCAFSSLFAANSERFSDEVSALLFA